MWQLLSLLRVTTFVGAMQDFSAIAELLVSYCEKNCSAVMPTTVPLAILTL